MTLEDSPLRWATVDLVARSSTRSAAWWLKQGSISADETWEVSDLVGTGHTGRRHLDAGARVTEEATGDAPLDAALTRLLDRLEPLARLASLDGFEYQLSGYGNGGVTGGAAERSSGCVLDLSPALLGRIAELDAAFRFTVYPDAMQEGGMDGD